MYSYRKGMGQMNADARIFTVALVLAYGCAGCFSTKDSICSFNLDRDEWKIVEAGSNKKIKAIKSGRSKWYESKGGNYLVCYNSISDHVCGGIYETFDLQLDGSYEYDHIPCMS